LKSIFLSSIVETLKETDNLLEAELEFEQLISKYIQDLKKL